MSTKINLFKAPLYIAPAAEDKIDENDYIISNDELKVLLNNISNNLQHPVTIIDFNEEGREDSKITSILIHYFCETLRKCSDASLCSLCDAYHARLFKGIDLSTKTLAIEIKYRIERNFNKDKRLINSKVNPPVFINYDEPSNRGYLQYECPFSGLIELLFPIVIEEVIVGVLFVGQIHISDQEYENRVREVRNEFLKNNQNLFDSYLKSFSKIRLDTIKKTLLSSEDPRDVLSKSLPVPQINNNSITRIDWKPKKITSSLFSNLISETKKEVRNLEEKLKEALVKKRQNHINKAINSISTYLNEVMQQDILTNDYDMDSFWSTLETKLINMVNVLGIRYISFYATQHGFKSGRKKFNLVAHSVSNDGDKSGIRLNILKNILKFDYSNIDLSNKKDSILSTIPIENSIYDDNSLRRCLIIEDPPQNFSGNLFFSHSDIFFYPVRKNLDYSIICVIGYKSASDYNATNGIRHLISKEIIKLLNSIMLVEYLLLDDITNKLNYKTLRIYRHEISHIVLGLRRNNEAYLKNPTKLRALADKKINNIYNDNETALAHLNIFTQDMGVLVGTSIFLNNEDINMFNDIIYKWRNMFEEEMIFQNKEFVITSESDLKAVIFSDRQRLDQIFYSILSNAIKYSFWGTRIIIDFKCTSSANNKYTLSVTSYGLEIENNNDPYELYRRGSSEEVKQTDGSGIGLYIAKTVSDNIGAELSHHCSSLFKQDNQYFKYNIPLINKFISLNKNSFSIENFPINDYEFLIQNKNDVKMKNVITEVVSQREHYRDIPILQVIEEINRPVYKTTFEVKI